MAFVDDGHVVLQMFCREQAGALDQSIRYGIAVTIEAGEAFPSTTKFGRVLPCRWGHWFRRMFAEDMTWWLPPSEQDNRALAVIRG